MFLVCFSSLVQRLSARRSVMSTGSIASSLCRIPHRGTAKFPPFADLIRFFNQEVQLISPLTLTDYRGI